MKFPRTIGSRISLGFGLLILAITLNAVFSYRVIERMRQNQQELAGSIQPSIRLCLEMAAMIHKTADLFRAWEYTEYAGDSPLPGELRDLLRTDLPSNHRQITRLLPTWDLEDRQSYLDLYSFIQDSIILEYQHRINRSYNTSISDTLPSDKNPEGLFAACQSAQDELENLVRGFDRIASEAAEQTQLIYIRTRNLLLISGVIIALSAILIAVLLYVSLVRPIRQYSEAITSMGKGVIPEREFREGEDEMGRIGTAVNSMIRGLRDLSVFAEEIGKGNFKSDFTPLSDDDILGNSLLHLREDLQNAAIEGLKRQREDERRNWANQGIARFSEILREHSGEIKTLAENLISELVKYLGARVGGIFLIRPEEDKGNIELLASYAYDRKKHLKKVIAPGEGLVGRCVQEGSTIYLTDIPEDYIRIKSGLGEDNPKSLLIVPIHLNELITGVIEIASLEIFEDFQIEFVERIGASIASSLSGEHIRVTKQK